MQVRGVPKAQRTMVCRFIGRGPLAFCLYVLHLLSFYVLISRRRLSNRAQSWMMDSIFVSMIACLARFKAQMNDETRK